MPTNEATVADRSGKYRWLGTFLLGASVPIALRQVGDIFLRLNHPTIPAGTTTMLAEGTLLATILLMGAVSFRMMRTGKPVGPALIFVMLALFWVGVLI